MKRLKKEKEEDFVNRLFQAHTINETIRAVNSGDPKTGKSTYKGTSFNKWLNRIGLGSLLKQSNKIKKSDYETRVKKARENVIDAVNMFSKGGE